MEKEFMSHGASNNAAQIMTRRLVLKRVLEKYDEDKIEYMLKNDFNAYYNLSNQFLYKR